MCSTNLEPSWPVSFYSCLSFPELGIYITIVNMVRKKSVPTRTPSPMSMPRLTPLPSVRKVVRPIYVPQCVRKHKPVLYSRETEAELLSLSRQIRRIDRCSGNSTILKGAEKLPEYFNIDRLSDDAKRRVKDVNALKDFYEDRVQRKCLKKGCGDVLTGFSEIIVCF